MTFSGFHGNGFPDSEKTVRLFAAVVPERVELEQIVPLIDQMKMEPWAGSIRWLPPENIHLTLRFLGDTDESRFRCFSDAVSRSLENIEEFGMTLSHVLFLPSAAKARVIATGVNPDDRLNQLAALSENAARKCGFDPEKKKFLAHFTIGRCKNIDLHRAVIPRTLDGIRITVKGVDLVQSILSPSGSVYRSLGRFVLKPDSREL